MPAETPADEEVQDVTASAGELLEKELAEAA
jgi:hypothetical protein